MTAFFLTVSFIIHGILIFAILVLLKKVRQAEELELRQKQVASEIEDLFTSYLMEIKEENNRMSQWLQKENTSAEEPLGNRGVEKSKEGVTEDVDQESSHRNYTPPFMEEEKETYQPSQHSIIFDMKAQGYSIEQIAKKMDKGKTEVELLYKFHQKTDEKT